MRKIYLIRHGALEFEGGIRRCIGRTEVPLSDLGRCQAGKLARYFKNHPVETVYTSPLGRCVETARILSDGNLPVIEEPGLAELFMGEWENVPMSELHKTLESEPKSGEGREKGRKRMEETINRLMEESRQDIAVVAHGGINCCYLSGLLGVPLETSRGLRQPYGGISVIEAEREDGDKWSLRVAELGIKTESAPDAKEAEALWKRYETPGTVIAHCQAVAAAAVKLGENLNGAGFCLDLSLIRGSAMVHDLVRAGKEHEKEGARILEREGYPRAADIIKQHHELEWEEDAGNYAERAGSGILDEAAVVFLADKWYQGTNRVSIRERFERSREKCAGNPEAKAAHERRYQQAVILEEMIRKIREKGNVK